jgi:sugar-specific transcriptional regulator TrmB
MNEARQFQEKLMQFGLTEEQAKIYLLLVAHKELRIQEIVNRTAIPRSSVYESLKKLYELGIAEEIIDDHFKKIRPYPIGILRHGLNEKMTTLQRLASDLDELEHGVE